MGSDKLPPVAPIELQYAPKSSVPQVRPWVRYWARMFDVSLFGLLLGAVIAMFFPTAFSANGSDVGVQILMLFGWVFVESLLLTAFGTTPGKTLFKTRLLAIGKRFDPVHSRFLSQPKSMVARSRGGIYDRNAVHPLARTHGIDPRLYNFVGQRA